jgi:cytochrome c oxidase subunit IV
MSGALTCGMTHGVGIAVGGVFAALSFLHVYWALGGTVGLEAAIPERPSSLGDDAADRTLVKAFQPTVAITLLVAGALATVSALVSLRAGVFAPANSHWVLRWSLAGVALILIARAVGDLNLVGFFKQMRETRFALLDTWLYCPLCVVLALGISLLAFCGCTEAA